MYCDVTHGRRGFISENMLKEKEKIKLFRLKLNMESFSSYYQRIEKITQHENIS